MADPKKSGGSRPVDVFAGQNSLSGRLKRMRQKAESEDALSGEDQNETGAVVKRGYYLEEEDG